MSDQEKSPWEKVLDELSSPWDWVAAALGAAGGAGITIATHGADLGTSLATGALVGVAVRKAGYASLHRRRLKRRALGFRRELEEYDSHSGRPKPKPLIGQLDRELRLWERRAISDEEFSSQLDKLIDDFRLFDKEPLEPPPGWFKEPSELFFKGTPKTLTGSVEIVVKKDSDEQ